MEKINERYFPDDEKITRFGFISHMEQYMRDLQSNPLSARPDEYLQKYGVDWKEAQKMLLTPADPSDPDSAIMRKDTKIVGGPDGKDRFSVKYTRLSKNYRRKMKRLFINNFEQNIIEGVEINEDGATSCDGASGQYSQPLFGAPVIRRKTLYITEEQLQKLQEATAGDIGQGYTVPFCNGDKKFFGSSLDHKNMMKKSIEGK